RVQFDLWDSDDAPVPRKELLQKVKGVDALVCVLTEKIDAELLDAAGPNLKVLSTMSVGFDHLSLEELKKRSPQFVWTWTPQGCWPMLTLQGVERVPQGCWPMLTLQGVERVPQGCWSMLTQRSHKLCQSCLDVLGWWNILDTHGKLLSVKTNMDGALRYVWFSGEYGTTEIWCNGEYVSMDELASQSDFLTVCCALTPETKDICNKDLFSKMKNTSIFINTSRGGVVDQEDLYEALSSGQIAGAGLDVTVPEPLPTSHPLFTLNNCGDDPPHIASASYSTRNAMSALAANNLLLGLKGQPMIKELKL
uniref:D-isomer specific 2-hydroxyacid dehydrogenase NAD-binding domain-containing protein n=1 Tax=Oncorhynchus tshawytscha TaxID=74940 RepID=A0AAZ3S4W9_ONCTS